MSIDESISESTDDLNGRAVPDGKLFTLVLTGDVDISVQSGLDADLERYTASAAPDVLVDLDSVAFFDSTGLSFLARLRTVSESRGGSVRLSAPTPAVRRLLELVGFDTVFTIEEQPLGEDDLGGPSGG
jgi:anti-anti-sigma factor